MATPVQNSYTLFPCGCIVDKEELTASLRSGRICKRDKREISNYIVSQTFQEFLKRHEERGKPDTLAPAGRGEELLRQAKLHLHEGEKEKAVKLFIEVLEIAPEHPDAQELLQLCTFGQIEEIRRIFNAVAQPAALQNPPQPSASSVPQIPEHHAPIQIPAAVYHPNPAPQPSASSVPQIPNHPSSLQMPQIVVNPNLLGVKKTTFIPSVLGKITKVALIPIEGFATVGHQEVVPVDSTLLGEETKKEWEKYPLKLSESEMNIPNFDFPYVLKVINGRTQSPSELAGLATQDLCDSVKAIEAEYKVAMSEYTQKLIDALKSDEVIHDKEIEKARHSPLISGTSMAGAGGAIGTFGGPPGIVFGALLGLTVGTLMGRSGREMYAIKQGSANRLRCLHDIDSLEKKRLDALKKHLQAKIVTLGQELFDLEQANLIDQIKKKEQTQLQLILHQIELYHPER